WYFSNTGEAGANHPQRLAPGIYGLSNARLDTPWPKVELGRERLSALLRQTHLDHEALADTVSDRRRADSRALARLDMHSPMDQLLSAQFIITERYGTRSTTTVWIDRRGGVDWRESSFDSSGERSGVQEARFNLVR
ncbi:MAG: NRDE family protein, partial [Halioglobus sp.]|nr:NRDE family protein [Halioglobus sp.]